LTEAERAYIEAMGQALITEGRDLEMLLKARPEDFDRSLIGVLKLKLNDDGSASTRDGIVIRGVSDRNGWRWEGTAPGREQTVFGEVEEDLAPDPQAAPDWRPVAADYLELARALVRSDSHELDRLVFAALIQFVRRELIRTVSACEVSPEANEQWKEAIDRRDWEALASSPLPDCVAELLEN